MGFCGYGKLGLAQIITSPIKKGGRAYVLIYSWSVIIRPRISSHVTPSNIKNYPKGQKEIVLYFFFNQTQ